MRERAPADWLDIRVLWDDRTAWGTTLSGRLEAAVRQRLYPTTSAVLAREMAKRPSQRRPLGAREAAELVRADRGRLRARRLAHDDSFWRPQAHRCTPAGVVIRTHDEAEELTLPVEDGLFDVLRAALAEGQAAPTPLARLLEGTARAPELAAWSRARLGGPDPVLVGHACVSWAAQGVRLWTDPFLRPKRGRHAPDARPLSPLDAEETRHIVLITHAHPDHFDPGSLMLFPRDTVIAIPPIEAETPLSLDLDLRLRQIGLRDVRKLAWGDSLRLGPFEVTAFPFHGEQPLGPGAQPERPERNVGTVWHVAAPDGRTALFLADSGSDPWGGVADWARQIRAAKGAVDLLFANHRTWRMFPPQYLTTSVPQYLAFVPDVELDQMQQIMLTPDELRLAAIWLGARRVVPYAMGGAPWFAELGLGYDHASGAGPTAFDTAAVDPFAAAADDPDTLVRADARALLLEPGQAVDAAGEGVYLPGLVSPNVALASIAGPAPVFTAIALQRPTPAVVRDLIALSAGVPGAAVIASPDYAELMTPQDADGAGGLLAAAAALPAPGWRLQAACALTPGPFGGDPGWLALFIETHARVTAAMREAGDLGAVLRARLAEAPLDAAPPEAIAHIARELVAVEITPPTGPVAGSDPRPGSGRLALPAASAWAIERWGEEAVALALMAVKLTHNAWVTALALDRPLAASEQAWFEVVFGAGPPAP